ncbi:hypothetical protein NX059_004047 [Plenodomus lindquistii]|nr:hypothetical protein NX059_004047 [Plenodomus lindquistii]
MMHWSQSKFGPYAGIPLQIAHDLARFGSSNGGQSEQHLEAEWYKAESARRRIEESAGFGNVTHIPPGVIARGLPSFWHPWVFWLEHDNTIRCDEVINARRECDLRIPPTSNRIACRWGEDDPCIVELPLLQVWQILQPDMNMPPICLNVALKTLEFEKPDILVVDHVKIPAIFDATPQSLQDTTLFGDGRSFGDLESLDWLFLPWHDTERDHWRLVVLKPMLRQYFVLDSHPVPETPTTPIRTWLERIWSPATTAPWTERRVSPVTQSDEFSSGIYTCAHAYALVQPLTDVEQLGCVVPSGTEASTVLRRFFLHIMFKYGIAWP